MKFGKRNKEKSSLETPGGKVRGIPLTNKEALRRLKEMEKNKAKSIPCPYLEICSFKILPQVGRILCLDQEDGRQSQAYIIHMSGRHVWEQCRNYVEKLREERGVLPRDVKKTLKELEKKAKKK